MIHRALLGTAVICLGLTGCGSPADPDPGTDASVANGAPDAGGCNALIGRFQSRLVAPTASSAGYTAVVGKVYDGETPSLLVWEPKLTSGGCTVLTPRVPFCSTPCGSAACVEDDTCQAYPTARSVGTVTVKGLKTSTGATSFSMDPLANNYQPSEDLPYPAFAEGETVTFSAAGSWSPAFTLTATGIAPLELKTSTITLTEGPRWRWRGLRPPPPAGPRST